MENGTVGAQDLLDGALLEATEREELLRKLGETLGLDAPVDDAVLNRVLQDRTYAYYLAVACGQPELLQRLLEDPANARYRAEASPAPPEISNLALVGHAAQAMAKWGKAGFTRIEETTFEQRHAACRACPHLIEAPDTMLYRLIRRNRQDNRICAQCGCVASRKARIPTESCPDRSPEHPGVNRWGQPIEG